MNRKIFWLFPILFIVYCIGGCLNIVLLAFLDVEPDVHNETRDFKLIKLISGSKDHHKHVSMSNML